MHNKGILADYEDVLRPEDVQAILHVGRNTVYKSLAEGKIRSIRIGNQYRIPKRYLIEYIYPDASAHTRKGEREDEIR